MLETKFLGVLHQEFENALTGSVDEAQSFSEMEVAALELVGDDDLAETLSTRNAPPSCAASATRSWRRSTSASACCCGDANLAAEANPFGPESIGDAYQKACRALDADAKVRGVLLKLFDDHVVDEVRSIY